MNKEYISKRVYSPVNRNRDRIFPRRQLPLGFAPKKANQVCRLRKSIYGLQQASRNWFAKLTSSLRDYGFI